MMRLGVRTEDEAVVVAPDFSTLAYMLEEYITLAISGIVIPSSIPDFRRIAELPLLLKKRVRVIDDAPEREAVSRLLHPLRTEFGVEEKDDGNQLQFPKSMPAVVKHRIKIVHRDLRRLAIGFNHNLQIGISPESSRNMLEHLRRDVTDVNARAILA